MEMHTIAVALLFGFLALSVVDGVYLHLVRYRLYARPQSWTEHLWHTARAVLFIPILWLVFAEQSAGVALYAGLVFVALDQTVELLDMVSERDSRASLGGLSSFEYVLHGTLTSFRAAAIALSLAARPADAWELDGISTPLPAPLGALVEATIPGAIVIAVVHVWLAWRYAPAGRAARAW